MPSLTKIFSLFLLVFQATCSIAQIDLQGEGSGGDVVVHGRNKVSEAGELVLQAVWRGVSTASPSFDLQPVSATTNELPLFLDQLIESGLGAYMDQRIHFSKQGVTSDLPATQMAGEMSAMVKAVLRALKIKNSFNGFSAATKEQLARLVVIDWSQAKHAVNGGSDQDKYLAIYYYVRSQREEFERLMRRDLLSFDGVNIFAKDEAKKPANIPIASSCGSVFDDDRYLCALDLQFADTGVGGFDVELPVEIGSAISATVDRSEKDGIRKRDRWLKAELDQINERIEKIDQRKELWELRDRMDDLNDRLTGLELEVRENKATPQQSTPADPATISDHRITIRFMRGSHSIDLEYRILLNEVYDALIETPEQRILITGHTDRVGDPAVNMKLSEKRAKAVRDHFLQRGIPTERLLINYFGDSRSDMNDPSQRRVEIEWLE